MSTPLNELTHRITLDKAVQMTTLYRQQKDNIIKSEYAGMNILHISETFNRTAFDALLAQPDCVAVRIYQSMDETLKLHSIAVGVNSQNEDILPSTTLSIASGMESPDPTDPPEEEDDKEVIIEEAHLCPPLCPPSSPLNP